MHGRLSPGEPGRNSLPRGKPCSARPRVGFAFGTQLSTTKEGLTRSRGRQFRHLTFHRNINKSKGGATQGLVFAKHQRKVAGGCELRRGGLRTGPWPEHLREHSSWQ